MHGISSGIKIKEIHPYNPALRREVCSFEVYTVLDLLTGKGTRDISKLSELTKFLIGWGMDSEAIGNNPPGVSPEPYARGALEKNNKELISELLD